MRNGFLGLDGKAREIKKVYVGVNGIARECVKGYVGVNGVARQIFPYDVPIPSVSGTYTYDRQLHQATINNLDEEMVTVSGTPKTSEAGTHQITFTLKSPYYKWADGTTAPKKGSWVINKASVTIPSIRTGTYTYDGTVKTVSYVNMDAYAVSASGGSGIDAKNYTVTFKLTNTNNYKWTDGTIEDKTRGWKIDPAVIVIPTITVGTLTYDGKKHNVIINNYDSKSAIKSGTEEATNAGTYTIKFTLKSTTNYKWKDNTTSVKSYNWSINKAKVTLPTPKEIYVYKDSQITVEFNGFNSKLMTKEEDGVWKATNAGSYDAKFGLIDKSNYIWRDKNSSNPQNVQWIINRKVLDVPRVTGTYYYNGKVQTVKTTSFDSKLIDMQGDTQKKDANTAALPLYTIYFNIIGTENRKNYMWDDGSVSQKEVVWRINKAHVFVTTPEDEFYILCEKLPGNYTHSKTGTKTVTASCKFEDGSSVNDAKFTLWSDEDADNDNFNCWMISQKTQNGTTTIELGAYIYNMGGPGDLHFHYTVLETSNYYIAETTALAHINFK